MGVRSCSRELGRFHRAGIKGSNRQNSGPPPLPYLKQNSLSLSVFYTGPADKTSFEERKDCAVMQMKRKRTHHALDVKCPGSWSSAPVAQSQVQLSVETTSRCPGW